MARPRTTLLARTADAADIDAVVALILADDPTKGDDGELRRLLRANAKITDAVAELGGYLRISDYRPDRDADGSIGVLRQAKRELRLANERRIRIVRWYLDNDKSAAQKDVVRPSYLALLEDMRSHAVNGLLALDIYRLYRQYREFADLVDLHDARPRNDKPYIATCDGMIDLSTPQGILMAGIIVLVGAMESAMISKRVREKADARFDDGAWHGGRVPFGYRMAEAAGRLESEPGEAEILREAARLVLTGWDLSRVVRHLNATGQRPRSGGLWRRQTVRTMLLNPLYGRVRRHQPRKPLSAELDGDERRISTTMWPAIFTDDEMARLKAILTAEGRTTTPARGGHVRVHLGSGAIRCGVCAGPVRGRSYPQGPRYACIEGLCASRDAALVDAWLRAFVVEAARGESDLLADAFADDGTSDPGRVDVLARLAVVQVELGKDPAVVVSECGLTFETYASLRRGLEEEEKGLLAQLVPAGRPGRVLPPTAELEALVADPANLTVVHDLLTTYLDTYSLEIVLNRVGKGSHNRRKAPGLSDEERRSLLGIEVRRRADVTAAA